MKLYDELVARGLIAQVTDEKEIREYEASKLRFKRKHKKEKMELTKEEMRELERLEKQEGKSKLDDN